MKVRNWFIRTTYPDGRTPYSLPKLKVSTGSVAEFGCSTAYHRLVSLEPDNLQLVGYECHSPIPARMHV